MLRKMGDLKGFAIGARDGDIGEANVFIFDDKNWTVRYLVADTSRWLPGRHFAHCSRPSRSGRKETSSFAYSGTGKK